MVILVAILLHESDFGQALVICWNAYKNDLHRPQESYWEPIVLPEVRNHQINSAPGTLNLEKLLLLFLALP